MRTKTFAVLFTAFLGLAAMLVLVATLSDVAHSAVHAQGFDGYSVYYVAPGGACGGALPCYATIQQAVQAVDRPGETVKIASGTYGGVWNDPGLSTSAFTATQMVVLTKTLTLRGGYTTANWNLSLPMTYPTTLDAQGQGRVLLVAAPGTGEPITATVEGLRLAHGTAVGLGGHHRSDAGGGVYVIDAALILSDSAVLNSSAVFGGGVYAYDSALTLTSNDILSSTASQGGGGVLLHYGQPSMLNSNNVAANQALYGAGLCLEYSSATLSRNAVSANVSSDSGGGICLWDSDAALFGNTITDNHADGTDTWSGGGGLYVRLAEATLDENNIRDNVASAVGGGLYLESSDAVTLSNNILTGNQAADGGGAYLYQSNTSLKANAVTSNTAPIGSGGGLYLKNSDATLVGNALSSNRAEQSGGGLYVVESTAVLDDNIISLNTASTANGGGLYMQSSSAAHLLGNTFESNHAVNGGGLFLNACAALLEQNTVRSNSASQAGGGMHLYVSHATVNAPKVIENTASLGGGVYLNVSNATLRNAVVIDNRADGAGSGLYIRDASPSLLHPTIARNYGGEGSGVHITRDWSKSVVQIDNAIIVNHTVGITVTAGNTALISDVLWHDNTWFNAGGAGDLSISRAHSGDPAFDADGYHITPSSAALDAGADSTTAEDVDGEVRSFGLAPDLGADEWATAEVEISPSSLAWSLTIAGRITTIRVPAGAVTSSTTLVFTALAVPTHPDPGGLTYAGYAFDLTAYRDSLPLSSFSFQQPVQIEIGYDRARAHGLGEGTLQLHRWDEASAAWAHAACGEYERRVDQGWLAVPICQLSQFALWGEEAYTVHLPLALRRSP
jgi:parallel beta-helix repeat protein